MQASVAAAAPLPHHAQTNRLAASSNFQLMHLPPQVTAAGSLWPDALTVCWGGQPVGQQRSVCSKCLWHAATSRPEFPIIKARTCRQAAAHAHWLQLQHQNAGQAHRRWAHP